MVNVESTTLMNDDGRDGSLVGRFRHKLIPHKISEIQNADCGLQSLKQGFSGF